jgi:hypothetical protein
MEDLPTPREAGDVAAKLAMRREFSMLRLAAPYPESRKPARFPGRVFLSAEAKRGYFAGMVKVAPRGSRRGS